MMIKKAAAVDQTPSLSPHYNQGMCCFGLQGSCKALGKPPNIRARKLVVIEQFSWFDARWERVKKKQLRGQLSSQLQQMPPWRPGRKQFAQF